MKFVIVTDRQFWGGTIVLHYLAKLLSENGYDASVFYIGKASNNWVIFIVYYIRHIIVDFVKKIYTMIFPKSNFSQHHNMGYAYIPIKGCRVKISPVVDDDTVVVYTETIKGNPLHAKNVVRWFLYYNRYQHDSSWYDVNDLFISYRKQFNDINLNPKCRLMELVYFNKELYKKYNFESRKGNCYIIRKGINRSDLPSRFDGIIIDDLPEKEKVKVFNECKYCYSYDTQTFYMNIAAICGCIPIVITEPGKKRSDYLKIDDVGYGVAYGNCSSEIDYAIKTRSNLVSHFDSISEKNEVVISDFIDLCQIYFKLNSEKVDKYDCW